MARTKGFPILAGNKFDEIKKAIDKFPVVASAVGKNSTLLLAVSAAIEKVAKIETLDRGVFNQIIAANFQLTLAAQNKDFKSQFLQLLQLFAGDKIGGIKLPPEEPDENGGGSPPNGSGEIPVKSPPQSDLRLLALLGLIPIAVPGEIIKDEYHNSLRNAVLAIATGLGAGKGEETITFAPLFQPLEQFEGGHFDWILSFNKALCPSLTSNAGNKVTGAFTVQLPQDASILSMTVRGDRIGNNENPTTFNVSLFQTEIDNSDGTLEELITVDLKTEFGIKKTVKISSTEIILVDNEKYNYFIKAEWVDAGLSDRFEINLIQILIEN